MEDTIHRTVQELHDRVAIQELKHRYCWCFDSRDLDGLCALFAEDATCELGAWGVRHGVDEIRDGYRNGMRGPGAHELSNALIAVDGDTAEGHWYLQRSLFESAGSQPVVLGGRYHDKFVKRDGRWLFSWLRVEILWTSSAGVIATDTTHPPAGPDNAA